MIRDELLRNDTAKHIKETRKLLKGSGSDYQESVFYRPPNRIEHIGTYVLMGAILLIILFLIAGCAQAYSLPTKNHIYTIYELANSIYKAEGGIKTKHPYGILTHYRHTTARQACINTIRHNYNKWLHIGHSGAFVAYLGAIYCPIGANNDNGSNKYWVKNVNYWLKKEVNSAKNKVIL